MADSSNPFINLNEFDISDSVTDNNIDNIVEEKPTSSSKKVLKSLIIFTVFLAFLISTIMFLTLQYHDTSKNGADRAKNTFFSKKHYFYDSDANFDDYANVTNEWRLDTGTNYTMNLTYWRNDYGTSKERHYYFNITQLTVQMDNIENDEDLTSSAKTRNLTLVNGQYPAPLIEANSGDTIYLHVVNKLPDKQPVSIHCHGLFYPNNPFDDGAVGINSCPIPSGYNYTYKIPVGKKQWGTYWYHSHWSTQYADGIFGPLVIHSKDEDNLLDDYDEDRIILGNDFYQNFTDTYLTEYLESGNENTEPTPDDGFINGIYTQTDSQQDRFESLLYFDPEKVYRLRLVNAGFFLPFTFSIDAHKLTLVEADGTNIVPHEVDNFDISVGQRYSVFLNYTKTKDQNYWMHTRYNAYCVTESNPNFNTDVHAIVSYTNKYEEPEDMQSWSYYGGDPLCGDLDQNLLSTLVYETIPLNANGSARPDVKVELDIAFIIGGYQLDRGYFNDMTWVSWDKNTSTMHQLMFNSEEYKCDGVENKLNEHTYVLNFDKRGQIVDLVLNNYDDGAHPFHLHGFKFWVIASSATGSWKDSYYDDLSLGKIKLDNPVLRDNLNVGPYGYAVIRFVVDNPGVFPLHCHIGWHIEAGLLLQINALQSEYSQLEYDPEWKNMCALDN
ncbi:uncharacterized protein SCODWIG_03005 [Saccharomycodes ludwigii]|uniref:Multicopper oxidase n=1 Tax=Saccharomycodes ludwigii TaxID=36035 RepID=A0A376B9N8_9ASCO|nr:hypothetical protein SCDLUD_003048 [Saccharomycodes ludwigii]KAH3901551.1 hypothetical protein SCDLUD_003048 [Saccharomycodes ludwigii]SSD61244.1 uncharacterized protein SCODWIG_03005 [Saccharomycodes ludwigii]